MRYGGAREAGGLVSPHDGDNRGLPIHFSRFLLCVIHPLEETVRFHTIFGGSPRAWIGAIGGLALCSFANAATICTFADPSLNAANPLFTVDYTAATIDGGWSSTGLLLKTPGLAAPDFSDVTFSMTQLTILNQATGSVGGGVITFLDSLSNAVFVITFDSAKLTGQFGLGASEFVAQTVTFTGTAVPVPLSQESFAFSFANQAQLTNDHNGFTATAAFTSSAVPEPSSIGLMTAGYAISKLRRRQ